MSLLLTETPTGESDVYRVSVDEFERMAEAGVFDPEARVELVNGVLVEMSPIGVGHARVVRRLGSELGWRLRGLAGGRQHPEPSPVW